MSRDCTWDMGAAGLLTRKYQFTAKVGAALSHAPFSLAKFVSKNRFTFLPNKYVKCVKGISTPYTNVALNGLHAPQSSLKSANRPQLPKLFQTHVLAPCQER